MADITTAQKARVLVDGLPYETASGLCTSDNEAVVLPQNINGHMFALGQSAGTATLTVTRAGQTGVLAVTVTAAPLVVTLDTPEPK